MTHHDHHERIAHNSCLPAWAGTQWRMTCHESDSSASSWNALGEAAVWLFGDDIRRAIDRRTEGVHTRAADSLAAASSLGTPANVSRAG